MRDNKKHCDADTYLLGYTDPAVHSLLDADVKFFGPAHRYSHHDYGTVMLIDRMWGKRFGDLALLHILLDLHILNDELVMKTIKEKNDRKKIIRIK